MSERHRDDIRAQQYDPRVEGRGSQVRDQNDAWGPHDRDLWRDPALPARDPWGGLLGDAPRRATPGERSDAGNGEPPPDRGLQGNYGDVGRSFGFQRDGERAFRAPKGYQRSDERIREDVSERLAEQRWVDPSDIEVSVAQGEVTLAGTVRSRDEKFHAEEVAAAVRGVADVQNRLRIRRDSR